MLCCNCERSCLDVNLEAFLPNAKVSSNNIKVLMISEALPKNLNDYFYTTEEAAFFRTTRQALDDAGYHIESISEQNELGIYLTTIHLKWH